MSGMIRRRAALCARRAEEGFPMGAGENRVQRFLRRCMCILCCMMFALFLFNFLFREHSPVWGELLWAILFLFLTGITGWLARRFRHFVGRYFIILVVVAAAVYVVVALSLAARLRFEPAYDLEAIYRGGLDWALLGDLTHTRTPTFDANTYFYYYPNNLGGAAFLAAFFSVMHGLGVEDYFWAACCLNACLIAATIVATALAARKLGGESMGLMAAVGLLATPPLWFAAAVFYTDFLSLLFPVLAFLFFLNGSDKRDVKQAAAQYLLAGLTAGMGILFKPTVGIILIAAGIILFLWRKPLYGVVFILCALCGVGIFQLLLDKAVYPAQLDKDIALQMNTPMLHWTMMSMQGYGGFSPEDEQFTRSFQDPQERRRQVGIRLKERIQAMRVPDMLRLVRRKMEKCFCNGTYDLHAFLDDYPLHETKLREFLLMGNKGYPPYKRLCNGIETGLFALALLGSAAQCVKKRVDYRALVPPLCILGLAMFLCMWETNARYIVNYLPMLALCAAQGYRLASETAIQVYQSKKLSRN